MNFAVKLQKDKVQKTIIKDLKEFFDDKKIRVLEIKPSDEKGLKFYQIHFDNFSIGIEFDIIEKDLRNYGYEPKRHRGNLPDSFYLEVLVTKQI